MAWVCRSKHKQKNLPASSNLLRQLHGGDSPAQTAIVLNAWERNIHSCRRPLAFMRQAVRVMTKIKSQIPSDASINLPAVRSLPTLSTTFPATPTKSHWLSPRHGGQAQKYKPWCREAGLTILNLTGRFTRKTGEGSPGRPCRSFAQTPPLGGRSWGPVARPQSDGRRSSPPV